MPLEESSLQSRRGANSASSSIGLLGQALLLVLFLVAGAIFAFEDKHWLPIVAISAVGIIGTFITRIATRESFESLLFGICFGAYEVIAALFFVINREGFGDDLAQSDSHLFLKLTRGDYGHIPLVPVVTRGGKGLIDSTLSVFFSQYLMDFARFFEGAPGHWPVLTLNILVLATALVFIARSARHCFPNRLDAAKIATGFSLLCPLFLVYGVELLRDGYAVLLVSIMLFGAVGLAHQGGRFRLALFAVLLAICSYYMVFLRVEFLFIPLLIVASAVFARFCYGPRTATSALLLFVVGALGIVALLIVASLLATLAQGAQAYEAFYQSQAVATGDAANSLGYKLVVSLPLPLRLLIGSVTMHINPIPLWAFFSDEFMPAFWLRSLNGIWICALMPLVLTGLFALHARRFRTRVCQPALLIVTLTYLGGLGAITITSLEIRHLSAFYPAFFILAAAPFAMGRAIWPLLRSVAIWWYGSVALVHLLWALLKFSL